jgi:hypothetical protein
MENKTLMLQSLKVAYSFLDGAEKALDLKYGKGFGAENPELAGLLMIAAVMDFHARAQVALSPDKK